MKISIIGGGNGGCALAADLGSRGFDVCIYSHDDHAKNVKAIHQQNGIFVKGKIEGFVKINLSTTDIEVAITDAKYIFMVLPAYAQETIFETMLPYC